MIHPLVTQLHFARSEFMRGLAGVSPKDARRSVAPLNCLSWTVGHLANQEQFMWVLMAQRRVVVPNLYLEVGTGQPGSAPDWEAMQAAWRTVTAAADEYLDTLTPEMLSTRLMYEGELQREDVGTLLLRNIYHYWFHLGEAYALREMLGHTGLPSFVGRMDDVRY